MPRPVQVYDFTAFSRRTPNVQVPGDRLDAQFAEHAKAIAELGAALTGLKDELKGVPAPREPTLGAPALYVNAGGFYAGDDKGATATSADYAQVSIDWAEHMPDTVPPGTLAVMGVTGSHWSSRWWANQAAVSASQIVGNYLPLAGGQMSGPLVIPVVADLSVGGGATGQVLTTVGSGILGWSTPSGTFIDAPSNSQYYSRYNGGWVVSPGGLLDAPNDGVMYARKSQAWSAVPVGSATSPVMDGVAAVGVGTTWARADHVHPSDTSRAPLASPTFTGTVTLPGPPTLTNQAATKAYVDSAAATGAGVVDGSLAPPGIIGETMSAVVPSPGVTLATGVVANVAQIPLSAGDWDVRGEVWMSVGAGGATFIGAGLNSVSATEPAAPNNATTRVQMLTNFAAGTSVLGLNTCRVNVSVATTYYLLASANFPSGTCTAYGAMWARRAR